MIELQKPAEAASDGSATAWTLDNAYQLLNEHRTVSPGSDPAPFNLTHSYDPVGNRLTQASGGTVGTYTYSAANRLTLLQAGAALTTYQNDAAGNRTQVQDSGGITFYDFDDAGRMFGSVNAVPVLYTYNALNQRVGKQSGGVFTRYLYDFNVLLRQAESDGTATLTYSGQLEEEGGGGFGDLLSECADAGSGGTHYYQFDAAWSTDARVDDSGAVSGPYRYSAFGLAASAAASTPPGLALGFGGQKGYFLDPETQFYLLGAGVGGRYYDPATARFVSEDPLRFDAGDVDLYRFVGNNPVNRNDPSGKEAAATTEDTDPAAVLEAYRQSRAKFQGEIDFLKSDQPQYVPNAQRIALLEQHIRFIDAQIAQSTAVPHAAADVAVAKRHAQELEAQRASIIGHEPAEVQFKDKALTRQVVEADQLAKRLQGKLPSEPHGLYPRELQGDTDQLRQQLIAQDLAAREAVEQSLIHDPLQLLRDPMRWRDIHEEMADRNAYVRLLQHSSEIGLRPNGQLYALNEEGQVLLEDFAARERRKREIAAMDTAERIKHVVELMLARGDLSEEMKKRLRELIEPQNLALFAAVAAAGAVGSGNPVGVLVHLLVILMFGEAVLEIEEGLVDGVGGAVTAHTDEDFEEAAASLAEGLSKAAQLAATYAAGKAAGKVAGKGLKSVREMLEEQEAAGGSRQKAFGFRKGMVRIGRSPDPVEGGGNAAENVGTITKVIDPQLDNNLLSALANPNDPLHAAAVEYANANKAAGLSVNRSAYQEFLKTYSKDQFAALKEQYGMKLIREIPLEELQSTATRLQAAFTDGRVLADADARVAASALLKGEKLATNDLQFFKRAKDLGLNVEYVGSGDAAAKAAAYVPKPVTIPSP